MPHSLPHTLPHTLPSCGAEINYFPFPITSQHLWGGRGMDKGAWRGKGGGFRVPYRDKAVALWDRG